MQELNALLRNLPQVDAVLTAPELAQALSRFRRDVLKRLVQADIALLRESAAAGRLDALPTAGNVAAGIAQRCEALARPGLRPVVNATGIVLHTNLGRAVLSGRAQQAVADVVQAYCNLEMDLESGARGHRDAHLAPLLTALTGCEAATVINNNAAAVYLILTELAKGHEVITSRGELVEIGGSFRVPDIVRTSGCNLVEVGTTNRTRVADYEEALKYSAPGAVLLKTHSSNFRLTGFTEETSVAELAALSLRYPETVLYVDLGSGYLAREGEDKLPEPDIVAMLDEGADLVSFSGDKLLGGPQAGIILGKQMLVRRLRRNPLWRALRIDKFTAAALEATLAGHLEHGGPPLAPVAMARRPLAELHAQAEALLAALKQARPGWSFELKEAEGYFGGGSLPEEAVPSFTVALKAPRLSSDRVDQLLRTGEPAIAGYSQHGVFLLNVLTLLEGDAERIAQRVAELPDE